ncbi:MAG: S8 family serine peptidase [Cryomorphaceae bacterium]|jgi:thermitase|nr:S8 family serine peptidase [Cryomorphaceae bacterium]
MKAARNISGLIKTWVVLMFTFNLVAQSNDQYLIVRLKKDQAGKSVDHRAVFSECKEFHFIPSKDGSLYRLTLDAEKSSDFIEKLRSNSNVEHVEIDYRAELNGEQTSIHPEDPHYYKQWAFENSGNIPFAPSKVGADIEMEKAWAIEQGDSSVVVAIIDTGVKWDHPEFNGRIWTNHAEIPNNGLDDDSNGYVDDVQGWDFADLDNNPTDMNGHGTNIASIVGANPNNSIGFAGMDWNCKLMNLKVMNENAFYSWWIEAIYYAVDNGAHVLNMSLGGDVESQELINAVNYALSHNVIVVVSMGNGNTNKISYPSNVPGVIAVGSTDPDDNRSEVFNWSPNAGSNYGEHISVVAPGSYIFGVSYKDESDFNTYYSGTSQATAYVSGLASLLKAQLPEYSNAQIKQLIEQTSEDQIGKTSEDSIGKDDFYGNGRINAFNALSKNDPSNFELNGEDISLYPNPANGKFVVRYPNQVEFIRVSNLMGERIVDLTNNQSESMEITLSEQGVFVVTFIHKKQIVSKKVVVL